MVLSVQSSHRAFNGLVVGLIGILARLVWLFCLDVVAFASVHCVLVHCCAGYAVHIDLFLRFSMEINVLYLRIGIRWQPPVINLICYIWYAN